MTGPQARSWSYAAAAAGFIANALFIAFCTGFAIQHFTEPHGVTAILGLAADYVGIPQNVLLTVVTSVVFGFLSRRQRPDQALRITGATAFATAAVCGVLTVTGLLPAVSTVAAGAILASAAWLLAIGIRGADLPGAQRARVARTARLIAATMLCSGVVALTGLAISLDSVVWTGLIAGCLAFHPPLARSPGPGPGTIARRPPNPGNRYLGTSKGNMTMRTAYRALAYLLALSVAVQASLIAFGAFTLENNIDNGPVSDGDTTGVTLHHSFAYVVLLCAVALLAVSFGAKVTHGVRWAAIPLGLIVAQFFLAYAAYSAAIIGVLHGLNALAIFAVALLAGRRVPKTAPLPEPPAPENAPSEGPVADHKADLAPGAGSGGNAG